VLHLALYGVLALVVAAALFFLAARFLPAGEQIAPPLRDELPWELPVGRNLVAEDVDSVRLPVALRGYRFTETDTLLDRLAGELRARDAEIARLRQLVAAHPARGGPRYPEQGSRYPEQNSPASASGWTGGMSGGVPGRPPRTGNSPTDGS
jgi:hypothetical protein